MGNEKVISLEPEFIIPQDGHRKQDCENAAAERRLRRYGSRYGESDVTVPGDDLYCKQPICEVITEEGSDFIPVCKPDSHKTLYEWLKGADAGHRL
jgi:hypothetical protein